jgi:hypothetical protein
MQPASDGGERSSNALRRYGPLVLIAVLLAVIAGVALMAGGGDDEDEEANTDDTSADGETPSDEAGAPEPTGQMPITYLEAVDEGTVDDYEWGDNCDTDPESSQYGHVKMPSVYAHPCVPVFEGDNGGETSPGVTADTIKVVRYIPDQSSDLTAILGSMGANDSPESQGETIEQGLEIYGAVSELYGRQVEVVDFPATGTASDVVTARADATDIAAMEPFAVIGGPALDRGTFAQVLAENEILCIECAGALPDSMIQDMAPYVWGALPSVDQFLGTLGAWVTNSAEAAESGGNLAGSDNAVFAGNEAYHDLPRKIGIIHFEQDPPIYTETQEQQDLDGIALTEPYVLDFATLSQKATELVARFKAEEITTVVFLGDPLMPINLLSAATEQEYFPEWVFTGTALTDTNIFGRQYDQQQMAHAFGISQLAAPVAQDAEDTVVTYRWYYGDEDGMWPAANQYGIHVPRARWLIEGIHMAGPDLTPESFAQGLFRIPPRGGGATTPQISYGNWGFFPEPDYQAVDDSAEIWWDPEFEAEDERGEVGPGVWRRAHNGQRFINADDVPLPAPFVVEDTVTVFDEPPPEETPPDYPPPAGSPGAG